MTLPDLGALVREAAAEELPALVGRLAEAQALAMARLTIPPAPVASAATEENLSAIEAARRLGMSKEWLYRHAKELPFTVSIGRRVLFSARGLERWSQQRKGR